MHRLLIRFALSFVVIVIAALVAFAWFGSSALLTPHRRSLEVRHQEMLDHPAEFGMKLEDFKVQRDDGVVLAGIVATLSPVPGKAFKTRSMADRLGHSLTESPRPLRHRLYSSWPQWCEGGHARDRRALRGS